MYEKAKPKKLLEVEKTDSPMVSKRSIIGKVSKKTSNQLYQFKKIIQISDWNRSWTWKATIGAKWTKSVESSKVAKNLLQ